MNPLDAVLHLVNFFAPALVVGGLAALFVKVLWRRELLGVRWLRLALWGSGGAAAMLVAGLLAFGRDGKMATYAAMVLACAASLGWAAFGARR